MHSHYHHLILWFDKVCVSRRAANRALTAFENNFSVLETV
ncbi:ataxin-10-like protein, partial [Moniliophthora roreri]